MRTRARATGHGLLLAGWLTIHALWQLADAPCAAASTTKSECLAAFADAQELRQKGALLSARARLLVCSQRHCPVPIAKDCASWMNEVEGNLCSVVFALSDEAGADILDARVLANERVVAERTDGRAVLLDPGRYTFKFEAKGYAPVLQTIAMRQSEKNRFVRLQLHRLGPERAASTLTREPAQPASAPPARQRPVAVVTLILGGTALASVGAFAYFGLRGRGQEHDIDHCTTNCQALQDSGRRNYLIADISLGVGLAAAVSAALVYVFAESRPVEPLATGSSQLQAQPARAF
jgi:hypothetical protein